VFILISLATGLTGAGALVYDLLWIIMVLVFSFVDSRNISLSFKDIHVASDVEALAALEHQKHFVGVPFFDADIHGIKEILKEAVGEKATSTS